MSTVIRIEETFLTRRDITAKLEWITNRIPSKEFRVEYSHTQKDNAIDKVIAEVIVWSDDAEMVAFDYWWHH